ncbi:peptidase S1 (plasmid) [Tistrella mobilis]|uniref:peptidase S1 n=1 Tax=Tistrella mobilis TaxID=171437 RepID=UPI003556A2B8
MKSTLRNVFVGGCLVLGVPALAADPEGARMAAPHFGTVQLTSGFVQDPYPVGVIGGGTVPAADFVAGCPGFLGGGRPDMVLEFQAGDRPLHLYAVAASDTALVVSFPDGSWRCADDGAAGDRNPALTIDAPASGRYAIWLAGVERRDLPVPGAVIVSEVEPYR